MWGNTTSKNRARPSSVTSTWLRYYARINQAWTLSAYFLLWEESASDRQEIEGNLATEVSVLTNGLPEVGEAVVRPVIEVVSEKPPDYRPPGRSVFLFR